MVCNPFKRNNFCSISIILLIYLSTNLSLVSGIHIDSSIQTSSILPIDVKTNDYDDFSLFDIANLENTSATTRSLYVGGDMIESYQEINYTRSQISLLSPISNDENTLFQDSIYYNVQNCHMLDSFLSVLDDSTSAVILRDAISSVDECIQDEVMKDLCHWISAGNLLFLNDYSLLTTELKPLKLQVLQLW